MKNLYLFQPQYSVEYRAEKNYWIPYSIGCIWSYAQQFPDIANNIQCQGIFFKRDLYQEVLQQISNPSICAFSCYQWNKNYNFTLARHIKDAYPDCVIVFGGPEAGADFLNQPYIDSVILGEGENSFLDLLRTVIQQKPVLDLYYKDRVTDLTHLPSPYATGVFNKIIADNPGVKWATTLETNRGCPFSCTFCDWGGLTYSKIKKFTLERVAQDLDWISANPVSYIFCADANFGIFKQRDLEIARLVKSAHANSQHLESFNATFNKNNNEWSFEILKELGPLNRGFTVSVQSMNAATLTAIKRDNLGINDLTNIFRLCEDNKINSYTELILGLPLESKETFINGMCELLELGQHNHLDLWFTDLLSNSELATAESCEKYGIKTVTTQNYLTLNQDNDAVTEDIQLVCETNTMSVSDMIESFMYGWIIVNLHTQGYTQLTSRFYNQKYNITFRQFYDALIVNLKQHPELNRIYLEVQNNVKGLLTQGTLPKKLNGHNLIFCNADQLYKCKQQIFAVLNTTAQQLVSAPCTQDLNNLQQLAIFDTAAGYPVNLIVHTDIYNPDSSKRCEYQIDNNMSKDVIENFDNLYYALRRKGALKNSFKKV